MLTLYDPDPTTLESKVLALTLSLKKVNYSQATQPPKLPSRYTGPALVNDKLVIYTMPVIMDYLEEVYPFPQLVPAEHDLRAAMKQAAFSALKGYFPTEDIVDAATHRKPFLFYDRPTILDVVVAAITGCELYKADLESAAQ